MEEKQKITPNEETELNIDNVQKKAKKKNNDQISLEELGIDEATPSIKADNVENNADSDEGIISIDTDNKKIDVVDETKPQDNSFIDRPVEPQQVSLDSLLYDVDDEISGDDTSDDTSYEDFLAEYHQLIKKNLSAAKELHSVDDKSVEINVDDEAKDDDSDILISLPENKVKKSDDEAPETELWNKEISLSTDEEKSDSPEAEFLLSDEELKINTVEEDGKKTPLFVTEEDEDFQLSFAFNEFDDNEHIFIPLDESHEAKYNPDKPRFIDWLFELVEMLVFTFAAVIILTTFLFKHSVVDGPSMNNTLQDGDHLIISDLFYTPDYGDIVVFEDYSTSLHKAVVKRIIALPGDTVEIKYVGDYFEVKVNGEIIEEDYIYLDTTYIHSGEGSWTVGEDEVFVMGDNRYNSTDSRTASVGPIKIDSILGRVLFRFYPFDSFEAFN